LNYTSCLPYGFLFVFRKRTQEDQEIHNIEDEGQEGVDYPPVLLPEPKRYPKPKPKETPSSSSDMSQDITEVIPPQNHARKKVRVKKATKKENSSTLASQKEQSPQLSREESNGAGIENELVVILDTNNKKSTAAVVSVSPKNVVLTSSASSALDDNGANGRSIFSAPGGESSFIEAGAAFGSVKGILKLGTVLSYKTKSTSDDIEHGSSAKVRDHC
jgi:hypothetical protein